MIATEIIFEVTEDEADGGYIASTIGFGIHTRGESPAEFRRNVKVAVDCDFDEGMSKPHLIRLHFSYTTKSSLREATARRSGCPAADGALKLGYEKTRQRVPVHGSRDPVRRRTPRGSTPPQSCPGQAAGKYPPEHRPPPRDKRRRSPEETPLVNGSTEARHQCPAPAHRLPAHGERAAVSGRIRGRS